MPDSRGQIRPKNIDKRDTSDALRVGWARAMRSVGKGAFADAIGVSVKTVERTLTGETTPELHTAFSSLLVDPTALDEVAQEFGFSIRPLNACPANDFTTIADLSHLVGHWVDVMSDGVRDHAETLSLAEEIRAILPHLSAIVSAADTIKGLTKAMAK